MLTKMLAQVCRFCPLCVATRRWPQSGLAKALAKYKKYCPACRAYKKIYR
jgi:hypothetical protein